jgi:N-acyl-D-aspartate/D-glutamate deacylase
VIVCKVGNPALKKYETMTVGEIARARNADPLDTMFDIALEDELETMFAYERANNDRRQIADMLRDPRTMIGLSDGGAHVDLLYEAGYPTYLLSHWVREKQVLSLEHAVKRITSEPADFFGFTGRGRIEAGCAADIVVFDADRVGSDEARLVPVRPADRRRAAAREGARHRVDTGERRADLSRWPADRRVVRRDRHLAIAAASRA